MNTSTAPTAVARARQDRAVTYLTRYVLLYFMAAVTFRYLQTENTFLGGVWELTMIPSLVILAVLPVFAIIKLVNDPNTDKRCYRLAVIVPALIISFMVATVWIFPAAWN